MADDFNPFIDGGARQVPTARTVFQSGSTGGGADTRSASAASDSPDDFDPFKAGATRVGEQPAAEGEDEFDPFKAGAKMTQGEDILKRTQEDPSWLPSNEELGTLYQHLNGRTFGQKAAAAAKSGVNSVVDIGKNAVGGVGEVIRDPSLGRAASTAVEAASGIGSGLLNMVTAIPKAGYRALKHELSYLGNRENAINELGEFDPAHEYEEWKNDFLTKRALAQSSSSEELQRAMGVENPEKPYPQLASTLSLAGQIAAGNAKALGATGKALNAEKLAQAGTGTSVAENALKNAGQEVPKTLGENALNKAGETVENVGGKVNKIGAAPRNLVKSAVTKVAGEDMAEKAALFAQGTLAHIPAVRGLAAMEGGGALAEQGGQALQSLANTPASGPFGRLVNLAKSSDAPDWLRGMAQNRLVKSIYGAGEGALPVAKGIASGTLKGAAGGTAFGLLSGDSPEELGPDIAQFAAFGGLHGGKSGADQQILQRRSAGVVDLVNQNLSDGVAPETIAKVPDAAMMAAADIPFLGIKDGKGNDLKVRFMDSQGMTDTGKRGADGYYDPGQHTIFLNADNLSNNKASWSSIFHEMLHPLFDSEVANKPELAGAVDKAVAADGKTLDQAKYTYSYNLLKPELRAEGVKDPLEVTKRVNDFVKQMDDNSQATRGDKDHWIRSEILADAGRDSLGSPERINAPQGALNSLLKSRASDAMLDVLQRMGLDLKPNSLGKTVIPGFQNVVADPSLRKSVYSLLKSQRENAPGMGKETEQQVKLSPSDMGSDKAPFYDLPNGRRGNKYSEQIPDGKGGSKVVMRNPRQIKKAENVEKQAMKKYLKPGNRVSEMPPGFYADPEIGEWTKQAANIMEQSIKAGSPLEGWYHGLGKSGEADWKASVKKNLGNVTASHQQFYPMPNGIFISKAGNTLADVYSVAALERKARKWMNRSGPLSLERWGGDIRKFREDVNRYNQNHAEGLPGEANNIGTDKKNVINAFLYGRNATHEALNPLRSMLRNSDDRQGIIRSLRVDRLETLHPSETDLSRPDYPQGVKNYSPASEAPLIPGDKYWDLSALGRGKIPSVATWTPEGWSHGMIEKGATLEEKTPGTPVQPAAKTPEQSAQNVIAQAASERPATEEAPQFSPKAEGKLENVVGDEKIPLIHFSSEKGLKTVDPKFFGKGKANNNDLRGGSKSYFFVQGSPLGGDENIFGQGGYNAHTAEVSGKKIYDLSVGKPDPLGYFKTINREEADDNIKDAGYDGVKVGTTDGRQVVMLFKPVPVKGAGEFSGKTATVPKPQFSPEAEPKARTPNYDVRQVAEDYMKGKGEAGAHAGYAPLNEELGKKTADWYEQAQHAPQDEAVKKSYDALKKETVDQWNAATKAGFKFEPWTKEGQPYKNSAEMAADVSENKHLYYYRTENGFGTGEAAQHPMLESSGIKDSKGNDIPVNDVFRAVHDLYGHAKEGYEFGPRGELNAYLAHSKMFSDEAKPAMGAETMGQNSWVNFGKHLRDESGHILKKGEEGYVAPQDRPFAEQKATVLPPEIAKEATGAKQYSPQTTAGKDLERAGYKIEVEDYGAGQIRFEVTNKEGRMIADMTTAITSPKTAYLTLISVASKEQGKGIGTALYHELAHNLQKKGIETLNATNINPKAEDLQKKVFGNGMPEGAFDTISKIDPNKQFSPPPEDYKGEYVKEAAIKIGDKIFTGSYHGEAQEKAENSNWLIGQPSDKRSALVNSMEDGFVTSTGRFIDREGAYKLAEKAKQITRESYNPVWSNPNELESVNFNNAKKFSPKAEALDDKDAARYAKRIAALTAEKGGTTFNVAEGKSVGKGKVYGVSIYPDRSVIVDPKDLTPERVQKFIKDNADLLSNPENAVGTWFDKESGKTYLDVSVGLKDRALAEYAGFKYNQKAIWDSAANKEIPTGGSGDPLEHMPEATERLDKLRREYEVQNPKTGQQQIPGMGRIVLNPKSEEVKNTRDIEAVRPDRELTPTERAASDLARKELKERVQLLPNIDDKVKVRRAFQKGISEVSEFLDKQAANPNFDSGSDWYGKDIKKMEATTHLIFPETKNADKMTMFKLLLAAFSGGETPKTNYQLASEAFAHYLRTGEVPAESDYRISETGQKKKLGRQATMTAEKLSGLMEKTVVTGSKNDINQTQLL